jgi:hypothetical protein
MIVISFAHFRRVIGNVPQLDKLLTTYLIKVVKEYTESVWFMTTFHSVQLEGAMTKTNQLSLQ